MSIGNFIQPNRWDSHTIIITARIINRGAPSSLIVIVQVVASNCAVKSTLIFVAEPVVGNPRPTSVDIIMILFIECSILVVNQLTGKVV